MNTPVSATSTQPLEWWSLNTLQELVLNTIFSTYCYPILNQGAEHKYEYTLQKWLYTTSHQFLIVHNQWLTDSPSNHSAINSQLLVFIHTDDEFWCIGIIHTFSCHHSYTVCCWHVKILICIPFFHTPLQYEQL